MLKITIPKQEYWNETTQEFVTIEEKTLQLEHSLISVQKWEAKWHKAFLGKGEKTVEETVDYIKCMTLTPNVDPIVYLGLTDEIVKEVAEYIDDPMTATTIWDRDSGGLPKKEKITAEVLYSAMVERSIPFECRKWHINQLIMLIRVFNERNKPEKDKKKRSSREIGKEQAAINAARRKALHSKG